ncbi:MAG TPA: hypothetical protein VLU24_10245 [Mycobacterium sp.]|nr:hypothetical protein [Mycobacterium sp.]
MTKEKDTPETAPDKTPEKTADDASTPDESKLRTLIRNILADLTGDDDTPAKKDNPADVAEQVRKELANVRKGESAEAERRAILDRLTKLEESGERETAPVLFRRIEKFMGWRLPDE